jgi:tetratricopeptide (TPR) repeat protein
MTTATNNDNDSEMAMTTMTMMEFPKVGVDLSYVTGEFIEEVGGEQVLRGLTTGQVCEKFIKPRTRHTKSSYAELLRAEGHPAFGGSPKVFISHAHSYLFLDLICALKWKLLRDKSNNNSNKSNDDDVDVRVIVWIDLFSINQHMMTINWTFEWLSTTFQSAIQQMGTTIMVMSPWDHPLPFTRTWCVFEAYCTAVTHSRFEIAMSRTDETQFLQDMKRAPEIRMNQMMSFIRADKSQCSVPSDKEAIFNVIQRTVGFARLDAMVFERYREWVLQVSMEALQNCNGDDDDDIMEALTMRQSIGSLLLLQGKYSEAQVYFQECFEASKDLLGEDDPDVLTRMSLFGRILTKQGRYDEAEVILESCVDKRKRLFGQDHVDTLQAFSHLASLYYCQEKYEEAGTLYQSIYEGRKALDGANHPRTLHSMNRLAAVLSNQERYDEAQILVEECFERRKLVLGTDHPHTLHSHGRLAAICYNKGDYDEAQRLGQSCVERQKSVLGEDHPHYLLSMSRLAAMLYKQGKIEEAKALNRVCYEKQKTVLGEDHPQTLFTRKDLSTMRL